jgi:hypothetical protein
MLPVSRSGHGSGGCGVKPLPLNQASKSILLNGKNVVNRPPSFFLNNQQICVGLVVQAANEFSKTVQRPLPKHWHVKTKFWAGQITFFISHRNQQLQTSRMKN